MNDGDQIPGPTVRSETLHCLRYPSSRPYPKPLHILASSYFKLSHLSLMNQPASYYYNFRLKFCEKCLIPEMCKITVTMFGAHYKLHSCS